MNTSNVIDFYEELEKIKARPAMYVGDTKLSSIRHFIGGYFNAFLLNGFQETSEPDYGLFHDFVARYYGWNESTAGWFNIIMAECYNNEYDGLNEFFKLIDLFKQTPVIPDARKILFKVLEVFIQNPSLQSVLEAQKNESALAFIRKLPQNLYRANHHYYKTLLEELNEIASSCQIVAALLQTAITTD